MPNNTFPSFNSPLAATGHGNADHGLRDSAVSNLGGATRSSHAPELLASSVGDSLASAENHGETWRQLRDKISERSAIVGVLGMGYVGLPLAITFGEAGFTTVGFDPSQRHISGLQSGQSHIGDVASVRVQKLQQETKFRATDDFDGLAECDVVIICVPTPLTAMREPDLSFVLRATRAVAARLRAGQLIVLESTTYPGTTEEEMLPLLSQSGLEVGRDFFLAYSPERIDPGNEKFPLHKVPKVVGGHTPACLQVALAAYGSIVEQTVPVSSTRAAELTKLLENIFRSVNIALVNEMALLCDRMGLDVWEIIDSAATKPYGFTRFTPGPGLGGHCIPLDPFYLSWKAREYDFQTKFIELAGEVNRQMPRYVVEKVARALNDQSRAVRGSRVALLGMSYKPNVNDCRESPSLCVAQLLLEMGAQVLINDPHADCVKIGDELFHSQPLDEILDADCVILLTNHNAYDYSDIAARATMIIDTRNAFKEIKEPAAQIIKL